MKIAGICGRCGRFYRGEHCDSHAPAPRSYIGIIGDAPTTASLPKWLGLPRAKPNAEPGKRLHNVEVPSKRAWREAVKRNSERIEDIS